VFQIFEGLILYLDSQAIIQKSNSWELIASHSEHFPGFKNFYKSVLQEELLGIKGGSGMNALYLIYDMMFYLYTYLFMRVFPL
jgi:hypothetical protein